MKKVSNKTKNRKINSARIISICDNMSSLFYRKSPAKKEIKKIEEILESKNQNKGFIRSLID